MSLIVRGLSKAFGGELALADVDLDIADGEIHALLGPNGSGKSTLIGCLSGRLAPEQGAMTIGDQTVRRFTPRTAIGVGTAVIYQHFSLIPTLSVADNIFLGSERTSFGRRISRGRQVEEARELLSQVTTHIEPRTPVSSLSVGQRQLVEIAKALRRKPRLLVLDEPTAALGELEARNLGRQLRRLRDSGLAILYVTHLISEVFEIADRVTVLRDGRRVLSAPIQELSPQRVISAIAPKLDSRPSEGRATRLDATEQFLELAQFTAPGIGPIDLSVGAGEVVAVFGLLGSGRSELVEGLYGLRGRTQGSVTLAGRQFSPASAVRSLRAGVALVPADRSRQGVFPSMSALDNVLLPYFGAVGRLGWRDRRSEKSYFAETARLLRLQPPSPRSPAWSYSGGNQQKLVVGRWLGQESDAQLLLLDEPTQGIDVGARGDLYELVRRFASRPRHGVLFTSSDPEEVQALADRAVVLVRGRIIGELGQADIGPQRLLDLAHGSSTNGHAHGATPN